jgi:hypothetical protein
LSWAERRNTSALAAQLVGRVDEFGSLEQPLDEVD